MKTARERIAAVDAARASLHDAGVNDAMRALARREYFDHQEAMDDCPPPTPATWDDVEIEAIALASGIRRVRASIQTNGQAWRSVVREAWEESLRVRERSWKEHCDMPEHQEWLRDGGPARVWEALNARKVRSLECAEVARSSGGDPAAFEAAAAIAASHIEEMVRLYTGDGQ